MLDKKSMKKNINVVLFIVLLKCSILCLICIISWKIKADFNSHIICNFLFVSAPVALIFYVAASLTSPGKVEICPSLYVATLLKHNLILAALPSNASSFTNGTSENVVKGNGFNPSSTTQRYLQGKKSRKKFLFSKGNTKMKSFNLKYSILSAEQESCWSDISVELEGSTKNASSNRLVSKKPLPMHSNTISIYTNVTEIQKNSISIPIKKVSLYRAPSLACYKEEDVNLCCKTLEQKHPGSFANKSTSAYEERFLTALSSHSSFLGKALSTVSNNSAAPLVFVTKAASRVFEGTKTRRNHTPFLSLPIFQTENSCSAPKKKLMPSLKESLPYQKFLTCTEKGIPCQCFIELHFCGICSKYQPLRTKHCLECGTCIRTMDHHCPWLGTCVELSLANFQTFRLCFLTKNSLTNPLQTSLYLAILLHSVFIFMVALHLMILGLLFYHTFLISCNLTTWENTAWHKITYLNTLPQSTTSPFSLSLSSNLKIFCFPPFIAHYFNIQNKIGLNYGSENDIIWEYKFPRQPSFEQFDDYSSESF